MKKNINKNENTNEPLIFTLIKDIELNTLTHCLIEILNPKKLNFLM